MNYTIQKLDESTWLIEESASVNVYMYLLAGHDRAVLLDTGYGTIPLQEIVKSLTELPLTVLCTHGHYDHICGNGYFQDIWMHKADKGIYQMELGYLKQFVPGMTAPDAPAELNWFEDAMIWDLGGRTLKILPTPGHTTGSVVILDVERRWLFTGDTCCKGAVLLNFDHSTSVETYRQSIDTILNLRDQYDLTWPAHHEKPIGAEIPEQFLVACDLLLEGKVQGEALDTRFGAAMKLAYQDVEILYIGEKLHNA